MLVVGACRKSAVSIYGLGLPDLGPCINFFSNGRHHTTVLHAVEKIERLRNTDEAIDSLLDVLTATLASQGTPSLVSATSSAHSGLIDAVALRVIQRLKELPMSDDMKIQAAAITEGSLSGASNR